jgi:hypothetical protein
MAPGVSRVAGNLLALLLSVPCTTTQLCAPPEACLGEALRPELLLPLLLLLLSLSLQGPAAGL